jgi:hypothetical protein
LQDSGLLYPIPVKLLNKVEQFSADNLPVSAGTQHDNCVVGTAAALQLHALRYTIKPMLDLTSQARLELTGSA